MCVASPLVAVLAAARLSQLASTKDCSIFPRLMVQVAIAPFSFWSRSNKYIEIIVSFRYYLMLTY